MTGIAQYNGARKEIESRFMGLPHAHTTLIKSLITLADPNTGMVENLSYRDLAMLLSIDHAPGRKGAGIPKKETIRSYLRTIADSCVDDFRLITQGQKLKCQFTTLPRIYAHFFTSEKVYTDIRDVSHTQYPSENTKEIYEIEWNGRGDHAVDQSIYSSDKEPVKNINILTNKHNKQTQTADFKNCKQPISPDFYPTQETINLALANGLTNVLNLNEIQKFIKYNIDYNCQWADFNPIFIRWLERDMEYQQTKQQKPQPQGHIRSSGHERSSYKNNSFEAVMARALIDNGDACSPSAISINTYETEGGTFDDAAHCMAMDTVDPYLRPIVHQ